MVYTLYVVSDAYLGLDQQYDLCLEVVEGYEEVRRMKSLLTMQNFHNPPNSERFLHV